MILITGGAGYIGSCACVNFLEHGFDVLVVDSLELSHIEIVNVLKNISNDHFFFERVDLKNKEELDRVFKKYEGKIEAVIHFAAYSRVEESVSCPEKYYRNNVLGSLNLFDVMVKHKILSLIFSSTCATYGEPQYVPIDEAHPQNPVNPYGKSKLMIEKILEDFDSAYGLKSIKLRYFNVAGADSQSRVGEWHEPESHLIPCIINSFLSESRVFKIYGTDYDTQDGTCIRDYVNVEDLVEAHRLAYLYLKENKISDVFNLGTQTGSSVRQIFDSSCEVTGHKVEVKEVERRAGDPAKLFSNSSKAQKVLGWKPQRSLTDSISSAYNWHKKLHEILNNSK